MPDTSHSSSGSAAIGRGGGSPVCKGELLSPLGHKGNFCSDCPTSGAPAENPKGADSPKLPRVSQSEGKAQQGSEQQGEAKMGEYDPARWPASSQKPAGHTGHKGGPAKDQDLDCGPAIQTSRTFNANSSGPQQPWPRPHPGVHPHSTPQSAWTLQYPCFPWVRAEQHPAF